VVKDIPLPSAMPDAYRTANNPFAPGLALLFDHFDFQVLDTQTHLLFIAHTGPAPDIEQQVNPRFNPDTDAKTDGNVIVFNTQQQQVVGLLAIPQVAGVTLASDLHKVYVADSNDNIIYVIDERTLKFTPIALATNDSPDSMTYDAIDHLILVSVPGAPANPDKSNVIARQNQNVTVIDALTNKVVARIPMGLDGQWGDDVGNVKFDPGLHRAFVVVQQLADPDSPIANLLPPPGTARIVAIDPVTKRAVQRVLLPSSCITPHGMAIDTEQHIAFIACINASPPSLYRFDFWYLLSLC
jgi:DNA-binding beta-propeller fold protein YncE